MCNSPIPNLTANANANLDDDNRETRNSPVSSSDDTIAFSRWRSSWCTVDGISTPLWLVATVGWLKLYSVLLTSKISLASLIIAIIALVSLIVAVVAICASLIVRRRVRRRCLILTLVILITGVVWLGSSILSRRVSRRNSPCSPASASIWVHPMPATSSCCYTTSQKSATGHREAACRDEYSRKGKKDEESTEYDGRKNHPSTPSIPTTVPVIWITSSV